MSDSVLFSYLHNGGIIGNLTVLDVLKLDFNVVVSVRSRLFVKKSKRVTCRTRMVAFILENA